MLNFNSVMLSTENLDKLADFYGKVFDKKPDMEDEGYKGFMVGTAFFSIGFHDKIHGKSPNPDRILFNFEAKDVKGEFERVSKIDGAEVVKAPYEPGEGYWVATLADPDGNYFQIVSPWDDMKDEKKD